MIPTNEILHISLENIEQFGSQFRVVQVGKYAITHYSSVYYDFFTAYVEEVKQAERFNVPIKVNCTLYRGR